MQQPVRNISDWKGTTTAVRPPGGSVQPLTGVYATAPGLAERISENGLRPGYSAELQTSISLSNWVAVGYILMTFPFIGLYSDSPLAVLLCLLPLSVYGAALWLIRKGYHLTARLLIANFCPLNIYAMSCLLFIDEANSALSAKGAAAGLHRGAAGDLPLPRVPLHRVSVGFMCALLLTIDYANAHAPVKIMERNVNTPALQILCFAEAIVFLVVFFSYYKYTNHKATARISQLLHDVTVQNERMIQAHAELMESEHMLKELNESKNKLFSIIAHDLRARSTPSRASRACFRPTSTACRRKRSRCW
jgi:hypothetical protein